MICEAIAYMRKWQSDLDLLRVEGVFLDRNGVWLTAQLDRTSMSWRLARPVGTPRTTKRNLTTDRHFAAQRDFPHPRKRAWLLHRRLLLRVLLREPNFPTFSTASRL